MQIIFWSLVQVVLITFYSYIECPDFKLSDYNVDDIRSNILDIITEYIQYPLMQVKYVLD